MSSEYYLIYVNVSEPGANSVRIPSKLDTCSAANWTVVPVVVNKDVASSHAAFLNSSGAFRSGFSQTSSLNFQSRVVPDQRSGRRCLAAS